MTFFPERDGFDILFDDVEPLLVFPAGLHQLSQVGFVYLDSIQSQLLELVILDVESVGGQLGAWVVDVLPLCLGVQLHQRIFEIVQFVGGCHLIEDVHFGEIVVSAVLDGQEQALDGVVDVDECPGLFPSAIDRHRVAASHLRAEPVQNCPEIAVHVDPVAQIGMQLGFGSADSPHDALVEFSNFEPEVFLEIQQSHVVQTFGHVVLGFYN